MAIALLVGLVTFGTVGAGCGSEGGRGRGDDRGGPGDDGGGRGDGRGGGDGGGGDGGGGACTSAEDCGAGEVCDPASGRCRGDVGCETDADCGQAAICRGGTCELNTPGGRCTDDSSCLAGETCTGGFCGCGGESYAADHVPPNVLIVLDRSDSMNEEINGEGTKWEIALAAIAQILAQHGDRVRFGLALFPGEDQACDEGERCGAGVVHVDPGAGTQQAISNFLGAAGTCNFGTPIAEMLGSLVDYPGLGDTQRSNYVLLITDGMATCDDPVPQATALRGRDPEVRTFVVGFGDGVDASQLADLAEAGGTARTGDPSYYQADSAADLNNAFASIVGSVLSCSYQLSETPPAPDRLFVYFDRVNVPRDETRENGWDYDADSNQVTFYGKACEVLRTGQVTDLAIVYGCPRGPGGDPGVPDGGMCIQTGMACDPEKDVCCDPAAGCYTRNEGASYQCILLRPQG